MHSNRTKSVDICADGPQGSRNDAGSLARRYNVPVKDVAATIEIVERQKELTRAYLAKKSFQKN